MQYSYVPYIYLKDVNVHMEPILVPPFKLANVSYDWNKVIPRKKAPEFWKISIKIVQIIEISKYSVNFKISNLNFLIKYW